MEPICPRCGYTLQPLDDAPPPFCAHCGLPQLRVSPDVLATGESPAAALSADAATDPQPDTVDWPAAMRLIGLAALLGVVPPALLPGALTSGGLGGPSLVLLPALTFGVISLYHRSRPRRTVHGGTGARMGALLGLIIGSTVALISGVAGFVLRYGYGSHVVDDKIQETLQQIPAQLRNAGPIPPDVLNFFQSPEFRAGSFLISQAFFTLALVVVGSICGLIAGSMLKARRERNIGG